MIDPTLVFIGTAVVVLLFASVFIAFSITQRKKLKHQEELQQLKEGQKNQLIEAAIRSEEIERHRIAESLHDEVGAILSSSKLHLQGIKSEKLDDRDKMLYDKGKELLDEGINKVRGISHNLHSNILKEFGLNEAIRHFISKITKDSIIKSEVELDDNYTTQNPENDISIFRMIQELVNNIIKYASASELDITSAYKDDSLTIMITHNGNGLTQPQFEELRFKKEGLGLKNIQNRIILLKGNIEFSATEGNSRIVIFIPLNKS